MATVIERLDFPSKVLRGFGAVDQLGEFCKVFGTAAFILGGKTALEKTEQKIHTSLEKAGVEAAAAHWYGGECSRRNIDCLIEKVVKSHASVIIAVGGGKALDTGKMVSRECHLPVITIPTIAATCAAITPLSVV